jgi:hypothetical protein
MCWDYIGRQLFERDATLATSDAKCIEEGDVAVDMSLFEQELGNLDIEDEDEEDVMRAQLIMQAAD